jgi:uncharacterized protein YbjT (DUF2867 family)
MARTVTTIFGGSGFLGSALARALASAGKPVRIASRHPRRPAWAQADQALEPVAADVRDEASVARAVAGAGAVVNAVSLYVESRGVSFDEIHVQGAARVARAARAAGVERLVLISGIGADPASPSRYVRARAGGEQAVRAAFPGAVIVRPSVLFGPDDAFVSALAGITRLPVVPLFGRGDTRLQPVLVDDVARGVARLLEGGGGAQWLFEFGGAQVCSYREAVELVLRVLGRRRLLLPVPFPAWRALAAMLQVLPSPPLTRDQVLMMMQDNVVGERVGTLASLGVRPRGLAEWLAAGRTVASK